MNKTFKVIIIFILLINITMAIVIIQQGIQLANYEKQISNLQFTLMDLEDEVEDQVLPKLNEILSIQE